MTPAYPPGDWEEVTDPEYVIQKGDWVCPISNTGSGPWEHADGLVGWTAFRAAAEAVPRYKVIRPRRAAQESYTTVYNGATVTTPKFWVVPQEKDNSMKLFIVAVIFTPKSTDTTKPAPDAELYMRPTEIMAKDEMTARLRAAQMIETKIPLDQCEVLVRPF